MAKRISLVHTGNRESHTIQHVAKYYIDYAIPAPEIVVVVVVVVILLLFGEENISCPHRESRVPYHPACGEILYRLCYPSPRNCSSSSSTLIISVVLVDSVRKSSLLLYILYALILENLCIVPAQCFYVRHIILRRNSDYFAKQHYLTGLCSGYCESFLCGRNVGYRFIILVL